MSATATAPAAQSSFAVGEDSQLSFADAKPRPYLSAILYGPEGEGKTTGALSAPGPIVYLNADRVGGTRFARRHFPDTEILELPLFGTNGVRAMLGSFYLELRDGKLDGAKSVVIDSLGRFYDLILADLAKDDKKPTLPERGDVNTYIERYILSLIELPFHVILVGHDNPVTTTGNEEEGTSSVELFPFTGTNTPGLAKKLMRAVDIVGYCGHREVDPSVYAEVKDGDLPKHIYRDKDGSVAEYLAQTVKAGGRRAKEDTGVLGKFAPLDLTQWVTDINSVYQSKSETKGASA